ncbi:MAG: hypothetical protein ACRDKT_17960 [Actinomycetota bacterium]
MCRPYQGSLTVLDGPGEEASFSFTGRRYAIMVHRDTTTGIAEILLDGLSQGTMDTFSTSVRHATYNWQRAVDGGPHTVTIRWTGTHNPSVYATGTAIYLDGIGVLENVISSTPQQV